MPTRWTTRALQGLAVAFVAVLVWTGVVLLSVRGDLEQARGALERARTSAGDVGRTDPELADAERRLRRATGRLQQPGPALFAAVPVVGRSVAAVSRTAEAALAVTASTRQVLATTRGGSPLLQDGRIDLPRLAQVATALEQAATQTRGPVRRLAAQPLGLVPGRVAAPARTARDELADLPQRFTEAAAGLRGAADVLGAQGPQRLLVLLENNAELRGTGGIVTVFAEAQARDGRLVVDAFRDVEEVADLAPDARRVPAPADFAALYGRFKADTTLWKNTNMDPDVSRSSQVLVEVADASLGYRPDAVLWLDVPTIAAVLRATGPAELPDGSTLRAEDAVTTLLSTAYLTVPDTPGGQVQRRAQLRAAADAVLGSLLAQGDGGTAPTALASELFRAAQGRHLALWSARPQTQAALVQAGVAGVVRADGGDLSSFAVHNLGGGDEDGNKLDFYARRKVSVRVELGPSSALVEQQVELRNTAPPRGLPVYVSGRVTPGTANNLVTLAVPADAQAVEFTREGRVLQTEGLPSGDHRVVQDVSSLAPGTTATWRLRYRVPVQDGRYRLALVPQPLAVDAGLVVSVTPAGDTALTSDDLETGADGRLTRSGAYDVASVVEVRASRPGLLRRTGAALQRFWREPVSFG